VKLRPPAAAVCGMEMNEPVALALVLDGAGVCAAMLELVKNF